MQKRLKLLFITATHGDEGFSIPVLRRLEKSYPKSEWGYDWVVGNKKALKQGKRYVDTDLNRVGSGSTNSTLYEELRAVEILKITQGYDMVVDIHGSKSPCDMVKIITKPRVENLLMTALFPELPNMIWYSARAIEKGPLVSFMSPPAIELECDMSRVRMGERLYQVLVDALCIKQALSWTTLASSFSKQRWFRIIGKTSCPDSKAKELRPLITKEGLVYPFLTNQYKDAAYYLAKKIQVEDAFLYE